MAGSNRTQLLPHMSPPPDQVNDTPLVLKGCMAVVALSLILQYVVHSWSKLKGRGGGGKVHCHWWEPTFKLKVLVDGGGTLLLRAIVVVIPLLLVIAGDVETNPGPGGTNNHQEL